MSSYILSVMKTWFELADYEASEDEKFCGIVKSTSWIARRAQDGIQPLP